MSLDVYLIADTTELKVASDLCEERGFLAAAHLLRTHTDDEHNILYYDNITHNLGKMAEAAGLYQLLWRPEELGVTRASQLVEPLRQGFAFLLAYPDRFKAYNPANGWGNYDNLVSLVSDYLNAASLHPDAFVKVDR